MSNRNNPRRKDRRRSEHGPRWENQDPSKGCNATHVARSRRKWRDRIRRAVRRANRELTRLENWLDPDEVCRCLNPWECGRPHPGPDERPWVQEIMKLMGPLSDVERDAITDFRCPHCMRTVKPNQWYLGKSPVECPLCFKKVDPECICGDIDSETGGLAPYSPSECPVHREVGDEDDHADRRTG